MTSLVAYGSDSEQSDDDFFGKSAPENEEESSEKDAKEVKTEEQSEKQQAEMPATSSFFFNSEDPAVSSDSDEEGGASAPKKKWKPGESATELDKEFASSIFDNEYAREERMNAQMLSRHVDLSEKPEREVKKSKFTCKNYLKGRCRFGDKCRFSHPVHKRDSEGVNEVTISSGAQFYTEAPEAQIFHSKKFKSSAGQ